ncbi:MAG: type II toxin-antitoxin system VapC family toxin [Egibacteraceae bacterium]
MTGFLARLYLPDEEGHEDVLALLGDAEVVAVTGTWTRVEVSGALVRAARAGRGSATELLSVLDGDLGPDGPVTLLSAPRDDVEKKALDIVRTHGLRAMDAWHLAVATLTAPALVESGETVGFASRDEAQGAVAQLMGLRWL